MKSRPLLPCPPDFVVYKELIFSFSRRLFFLASSSSRTRAVRPAVAAFFIPVALLGVDVPDCGVPVCEILAAAGLLSPFVLFSFVSPESPVDDSVLPSPFAFRFLLPLAFFREWVNPSDLRVSMRSITKALSLSVLGSIGMTSRSSYGVAHWTHFPSLFISLMASCEKAWPQGTR